MTVGSNKNNARDKFRIIAGKWRSRKLSFPGDIPSLRPTTDRIRETVFNWLQLSTPGARCLDLFAGSGALAFEACSRGAGSVTALDISPRVTAMLRENCSLLDCDNMQVITADGLQWLRDNSGKTQFDIVFLDPPYALGLLPDCLKALESGNFLAPGAVIYMESDTDLDDLPLPGGWNLQKSRKAGQVFYGVCGA